MKIIHTADLHIDSPLSSKLPAAKVAERRRELSTLLRRLADEAERIGAEAIIIAGDLFDSDRLSKKNRDRALAVIERAQHITFFYLSGNHEGDVLREGGELPKNLKLFERDWTRYDLGNVSIVGRSETSRDMFESLRLDKERINIALLHGELRERSDKDGVIGARDAAGRHIDYLALGHYHSYSHHEIDSRATAVYAGTPEGRGFDETGDKGYVLIEVKNDTVSHKFVKFANRTLHIAEVDISAATSTYDVSRLVESRISGIPASDLVRVVLTGHYDIELKKDLAAIHAEFYRRFYFFEVRDESRLFHSPDSYKNDKSLKGEFIRLVLSDATLTDDERERIISCGLSALVGEAFDE